MPTTAFALPDRLAGKATGNQIAADETRFAQIRRTRDAAITDVRRRLAEVNVRDDRGGQAALDRDTEARQLSRRLRALERFSLEACLGRLVPSVGGEPVYIGRFGLTDDDGVHLLLDWRTPAAEPFFAATHATPMGVASRRRYRWSAGRVVDYWDEVFEGDAPSTALDDQSGFIATLGASRSPRMRDVLSTIASDQDAIIREGSAGALVIDGGPGTGKTVVALHRAAYLLYADPHLKDGRHGGVLFVGPHRPYLSYVADVLPSLGEESVQLCTVSDLTPEGAAAVPESPSVAAIKARARMLDAIEPAVALYEEPPTKPLTVSTPWADVAVSVQDWADAFASAEPGATHNEARDQVWEQLVTVLLDRLGDVEASERVLRRALATDDALTRTFNRAWPILEAGLVIADLWSVPAYRRRCAPWLSPDDVAALQRAEPRAWTDADLPFLDAARRRIGDPAASGRARRRDAARERERERRSGVIDELLASSVLDDGEGVLTMLAGEDVANSLDDDATLGDIDPDRLEGPFAHIIVDEAQELTEAQWRMLVARCPSRSFTIVGDRAQARNGFRETWTERLDAVGLRDARVQTLAVNYRTPREVMAMAEPAIRAAIPDANVPTAIRDSGHEVIYGGAAQLREVLDRWLATHADGVACVIGDASFEGMTRVRSLTPSLAKGLEFDLVVLVDPDDFGDGIEGAVDRYVAMTRSTSELVILRSAS